MYIILLDVLNAYKDFHLDSCPRLNHGLIFGNGYRCYWFIMPITADFSRRLMSSKTTIALCITAIVAIALLLVPFTTNQQVLAANLCGSGLGCGHYGGYGFHHFFHHFFPYYGCSDCSGDYDYQ